MLGAIVSYVEEFFATLGISLTDQQVCHFLCVLALGCPHPTCRAPFVAGLCKTLPKIHVLALADSQWPRHHTVPTPSLTRSMPRGHGSKGSLL